MKVRVHWIVSGEIEMADDIEAMGLKKLEDILDYVPEVWAVKKEIARTFTSEVELLEVLDTNGVPRITFDFSPAAIQLYEGRKPNDKSRRTMRKSDPHSIG